MGNKENLLIDGLISDLEKLNGTELVTVLSSTVVFLSTYMYGVNKAFKSYGLKKRYKPRNVSSVVLPPELKLKYNQVNEDKINELGIEYKEYILDFIKTMLEKFPKEYLTIFINNINEMQLKSKDTTFLNLFMSISTSGKYDVLKNEIILNEDLSSDVTLYHELFHLASSYYNGKTMYSGFNLKNQFEYSLCRGLNEGYTVLLTSRYFKEDNISSKTYQYLSVIAEQLEEIVDKEKMEKLYLTANLRGLIDELKNYSNEENIMKFFSNTDFIINNVRYPYNYSRIMEKLIIKALNEINKFLITGYAKKITKDNNITEQELIKVLNNYQSYLIQTISKNLNISLKLDNNDINTIVNHVIDENNLKNIKNI